MKRSALATLLLALAISPAYAKELNPTVVLEKITPVKTTEKNGDEVYINITEYLPDGKTKSSNIPIQPLSWASKDLKEVKALTLWSTKLAQGQSADVIMTFVEQDNPPYDPDDLLGVVQLKVMNTKKGLKTLWSVREGSIKSPAKKLPENKQHHFILTGNHGSYEINMKLFE